jgi:hypothetical protein
MRTSGLSSSFRRTLIDPRAAAAARAPRAEERTPSGPRARGADGHPVRAAHGRPLGDASGGNGLRLGRDLLAAAAARLATGGHMAAPAQRTTAPTAAGGSDRLEPGQHGQRIRCGEKGGAATGPNWTDRGTPGIKRRLATDRRGIPPAFMLTGTHVSDSVSFETLLEASPRLEASAGVPAAGPTNCTPTRPITPGSAGMLAADVASRRAPPGAGSSAARNPAATDGSLSEPSRVSLASDASPSATRNGSQIYHTFASPSGSLICLNALLERFWSAF